VIKCHACGAELELEHAHDVHDDELGELWFCPECCPVCAPFSGEPA